MQVRARQKLMYSFLFLCGVLVEIYQYLYVEIYQYLYAVYVAIFYYKKFC